MQFHRLERIIVARKPLEDLSEGSLPDEILSVEPAFDPHYHILLHREPLERITDDDYESAEGEALKDAMIQEKIFERIRAEEYRTSILEVDPTPEVLVGSLRGDLGRDAEFERISDDESEGARESERFAQESRDQFDERDESPESESADESPENEEHAADTANTGELEDASAELRWQQPREEFATRRGGRGRRRFGQRRLLMPQLIRKTRASHLKMFLRQHN